MIDEPETTFDSLADAISFTFRHEQTSILSLDRIGDILANSNLFINNRSMGRVPCSTIPRRRISSTLSNSDLFVRAGPPRACRWAIRPHNPLFLSDSSIVASIETMLTANGPMTVDQLVQSTTLCGANTILFDRVLNGHKDEYSVGEDGTWWFANQTRPEKKNYDNLIQAILSAFKNFPDGASIEELHWFLCLSTYNGGKTITRRCISRELSRKPELFRHLSRARYVVVQEAEKTEFHSLPIELMKNDQFLIDLPPPTHFQTPKMPLPILNGNAETVETVETVDEYEVAPHCFDFEMDNGESFDAVAFFARDYDFEF